MSIVNYYIFEKGRLRLAKRLSIGTVLKKITTPGALYTRSRRMVINPLNENFTPEEQGKIAIQLRAEVK